MPEIKYSTDLPLSAHDKAHFVYVIQNMSNENLYTQILELNSGDGFVSGDFSETGRLIHKMLEEELSIRLVKCGFLKRKITSDEMYPEGEDEIPSTDTFFLQRPY